MLFRSARCAASGSGRGPSGVPSRGRGGSEFVGNVATNNDDGIEIDSGGAIPENSVVLTRNTANDNGDFGIEAVLGVTDGGGNKASGNGNPLQCLNVFCR